MGQINLHGFRIMFIECRTVYILQSNVLNLNLNLPRNYIYIPLSPNLDVKNRADWILVLWLSNLSSYNIPSPSIDIWDLPMFYSKTILIILSLIHLVCYFRPQENKLPWSDSWTWYSIDLNDIGALWGSDHKNSILVKVSICFAVWYPSSNLCSIASMRLFASIVTLLRLQLKFWSFPLCCGCRYIFSEENVLRMEYIKYRICYQMAEELRISSGILWMVSRMIWYLGDQFIIIWSLHVRWRRVYIHTCIRNTTSPWNNCFAAQPFTDHCFLSASGDNQLILIHHNRLIL